MNAHSIANKVLNAFPNSQHQHNDILNFRRLSETTYRTYSNHSIRPTTTTTKKGAETKQRWQLKPKLKQSQWSTITNNHQAQPMRHRASTTQQLHSHITLHKVYVNKNRTRGHAYIRHRQSNKKKKKTKVMKDNSYIILSSQHHSSI